MIKKVRYFLFFILLILSLQLFSVDLVSIYDLQFTTVPGFDGTYPSLYINKTVLVQGIVTAVGYENNRIFISESQGGAWRSIAIELGSKQVSIGDLIEVQGKVSEVMGMTVITQSSNFKRISRNNFIPEPVHVSVQEALTSESYESVLVKLTNIICKKEQEGVYLAVLGDGTTNISIGNGFHNSSLVNYFQLDESYYQVVGIINYSFSRFTLHPRDLFDVSRAPVGSQSSSWGKIKSLYR